MTKDGIAGIICTIVFGIAVALIGRDWLVSAFSADPLAAICFTLCAVALGYFACSAFHHGDYGVAGKLAAAEAKYDFLLAQVSSGNAEPATGLSPQDIDDRIRRHLDKSLSAGNLASAYAEALKADREDPSRLWKERNAAPHVTSSQLRPSQWPRLEDTPGEQPELMYRHGDRDGHP